MGYDLYLKGTNSDLSTNKSIILDSSSANMPLRIGDKFKVGWDGNLTCNEITYLGMGN
jgi:hypothetical protein